MLIMVNILNHFKKVWGAYKTNFIPIVLSVILITLTILLFFGLGFFALLGTEGATEIANSYLISGEVADFESPDFLQSLNLQTIGFFFLFIILGAILAIFLQAGFWGLCLGGVKKKVNMKTFFTTIRERGIVYFFASLLVLLIIAAISIPLILIFYAVFYLLQLTLLLPITYIILLLFLTPLFIFVSPAVISGKSIFDSLSQSFKLGKENYFDLILLIVLVFIFSMLSFIPIIGIILVYFLIAPLFTLVVCSFYLEISKNNKIKIKEIKSKIKLETKRKKLKKATSKKLRISDRGKKKTKIGGKKRVDRKRK